MFWLIITGFALFAPKVFLLKIYIYIHTYVYVHIIMYCLYILPGEVDIGGSSLFSDCTISNKAGTLYLKVIDNKVKVTNSDQEAQVHSHYH